MFGKYLAKIPVFFVLIGLSWPGTSYGQELRPASARIAGYWFLAEEMEYDEHDRIISYMNPAGGVIVQGWLGSETGEFEESRTRKIKVVKDLPDKIEMASEEDGSSAVCVFQSDDQITCRDSFSPDKEVILKRLSK